MKMHDNDTEARHLLRAFMGLALLPTNHIDDAFKILKEKVETSRQHDQLEPFVSYFKNE